MTIVYFVPRSSGDKSTVDIRETATNDLVRAFLDPAIWKTLSDSGIDLKSGSIFSELGALQVLLKRGSRNDKSYARKYD